MVWNFLHQLWHGASIEATLKQNCQTRELKKDIHEEQGLEEWEIIDFDPHVDMAYRKEKSQDYTKSVSRNR